ncbi:LAMI_0G14070g1_1 [Lachancea mirantina]|uniref:LAMI_0G14070g1_1 n=1 Tax=Lachancea mirantina TaxID=1230905 RepID=A0A1G4KBX2_9SACH|nr:LAMI_0G14070g1_1 [Lachancea mirantina]
MATTRSRSATETSHSVTSFENVPPKIEATREPSLQDPGNHSRDHFKKRMSKTRFWIRDKMLRFTENQSDTLYAWQSRFRRDALDRYFGYTSLMGSHTFYVIMLPLPRWLGMSAASRDLVYVLGYSIYLSGYLKDYWCLPRPVSPPLTRVTLSGYTTKEYGAPSSHTANATSVAMLLAWYLYLYDEGSMIWKTVAMASILFYYLTLTLGRIYCGMHGILDIVTGAMVGAVCFAGRFCVHYYTSFDQASMHEWGWWFPVTSISFGLFLLYFHAKPVDECPCFDDSVAFIGVIAGIECSDWLQFHVNNPGTFQTSYDFSTLGIRGTILRTFVGVSLVILWKSVIGKKVIFSVLNRLTTDDRHLYVVQHNDDKQLPEISLFHGRSNTNLIGRFFLYAGVPAVVVLACPLAFRALNL